MTEVLVLLESKRTKMQVEFRAGLTFSHYSEHDIWFQKAKVRRAKMLSSTSISGSL